MMITSAKRSRCNGVVALIAGLVLLPAAAGAQTAGSGNIAGVVRDTSGAVLPGVTAEAASPALIEKVRTVVTDASGQYRITDLRPGAYTVTFTLVGFATVRREGIELSTGFTATVNAEMQVGSLEETITVVGASPIVDTQNVSTNAVFSHDVLEALPSGSASTKYAALILGATSALGPDVGGSKGEMSNAMQIHGSRQGDYRMHVDGMQYNFSSGGGNLRAYYTNPAATQEMVLEYANASAETETGGISQNAVPRDGGNTFSAMGTANYAGPRLQADNLNQELRDRGVTEANSVKRIYDDTIGLGGPIKRDKLWFYTAHRLQSAQEYYAGIYFNKRELQNTVFYEEDRTRRGFLNLSARDHTGRLTWQQGKHKYTFLESFQSNLQGYFEISGNTASLPQVAPEATGNLRFYPISLTQTTWSYPASNRLLLQAGFTYGHNTWFRRPVDGNTPAAISIFEQSTGFRYGSRSTYTDEYRHQWNGRVSASYVTGAHNSKVGLYYYGTPPQGEVSVSRANGDINYTFRKPTPGALPVPVSVTLFATPTRADSRRRNIGIYAQDQWTLSRLTLNLGIRLDTLKEWAPAQTRPAGRWVPATSFEKVDNIPRWRDVDPRLGIAWDLFGNGKTAIKGAVGRFVVLTGAVGSLAPVNAIVVSANRNWDDANKDYIPQESELGPLSNSAFGTSVINTRWADDLVTGWHTRQFSWQDTVAFSHELRPGLGFEVAYFRTSFGNPTVTDNVLVTPADYSPFCVTAPVDSRLPNGGGYEICGLYDINPNATGRVSNVSKHASDFGKLTEVYNGLEVTATAKFGRGGRIAVGVSKSTTIIDSCDVTVDSPQKQFCRTNTVNSPNNQFKINGSYPLPRELQFSWVYQNLQGAPILATRVYTNAQIAPSLGRNLGSCGTRTPCTGTVTVNLIEQGTMFEKRYTQLDIRLSKTFRMGRWRVQPQLDAYNVLNGAAFTGRNNAYGPIWNRPNGMQLGRLFKLGTQVDW